MPEHNFQLRLSLPFSTQMEGALNVIAGWGGCIQWLAYEHEADDEVSRTHCHIYFFEYMRAIDTFRTRVREQYPNLPKTDWACSETAGRARGAITINGAVRYASKCGTIHFKKCQGLSEENITEMENSMRVENIPAARSIIKGKQLTRYRQVCHLMELIAEQTAEINENRHHNRDLYPGEIFDIITKWARENGQTLTEYRILELITTIRIYSNDTDGMRERILKKIGE